MSNESHPDIDEDPMWASEAECEAEDDVRFMSSKYRYFLATYQTPCGGHIVAIIRLGDLGYPEQWILMTANTPPFPKDRWLTLDNIGSFTSPDEMYEAMMNRPGWDLDEVEFRVNIKL